MDGGQVSQYSYSPSGLNRPEGIVNSTLSLDLSVSWRPEDVRMRRIEKSAPNIIRQAIFTDHASSIFYTWGGLIRDVRDPQTELWKFKADDVGGGSWSTETEPNHDMGMLRRSYGGAFASTPESGFYFGGMSEETDKASGYEVFVSGFFQFDYASQQQSWTNHTETPYSSSKTLYSASAHYVPMFGTKGLVMILGGSQWDPEAPGNLSDISMEEVSFMDPATKRWYSQQTSGTAPPRRRWFCTVGANSTGNTYEIFVFGGENSGRGFDDVYMLSLPGFVWKQAEYTPKSPRAQMDCVVAGQRQMITIGGLDPGAKERYRDRDPFPQGLGVFDLTGLEWKTQYDAGAAPYETPDIVKSWYDEGSVLSSAAQTLFLLVRSTADRRRRNLAQIKYSAGVEDLLNLSSSVPNVPSGSRSKQLSPGAMGGIAGGSVLGAALVGLVAFLLVRRLRRPSLRKPEAAVAAAKNSDHPSAPASTTLGVSEHHKRPENFELDAQDPRYQRAELHGNHSRVELPV
ncbi:kelch repeat protein [Colletotrichum plurivorum]|uniref:Kelch repeat protein n=1 Tax=Colletotrichum plurivorum TaxID=2175906 RepID=A0A8H6KEW9_9PEZI|nr:kelch repeat protein [Colletotrichum plurivorum]